LFCEFASLRHLLSIATHFFAVFLTFYPVFVDGVRILKMKFLFAGGAILVATRSRSVSDNRTGLSFITLATLRYLDARPYHSEAVNTEASISEGGGPR
jgi:hypothetical protein